MDVTIYTSDETVQATEIHEALSEADYFVTTVTVVDRETGTVIDSHE